MRTEQSRVTNKETRIGYSDIISRLVYSFNKDTKKTNETAEQKKIHGSVRG